MSNATLRRVERLRDALTLAGIELDALYNDVKYNFPKNGEWDNTPLKVKDWLDMKINDWVDIYELRDRRAAVMQLLDQAGRDIRVAWYNIDATMWDIKERLRKGD